MRRVRSILLSILFLVTSSNVVCAQQAEDPLVLAQKNYAALLAQAQKNDPKTDWRALRMAYAESNMSRPVVPMSALYPAIFEAMRRKDAASVKQQATDLIQMNYTDMMAHKFLAVSCEMTGDAACMQREEQIAASLMRSVTDTGDGKTCNTGWEVISIDEEYYILGAIEAQKKGQRLVRDKHTCDEIQAEFNGKNVTFYFNIDPLVRRYEALQNKGKK